MVCFVRNIHGWLLGAMVFIVCCVTDIRLIRDFFETSQLPLWDPAEYTWIGRKLSYLLSQGELLSAVGTLNQRTFHPPFHALVSIPFHFTVSNHYLAAMLVNWSVWILIRFQMWRMGLKLDRESGHRLPWIAFFSTASLNSSMLFREFVNVVNLELLGTLIVMITIDQYSAIFSARTRSEIGARLVGLGIALAFFTKYNLILFVIPVILIFEWIQTHTHKKDHHRLSGEDRIFVGILLGLSCMGWFIARHPGRLEGVSVRGIANLLYGVVLLWVLYGTGRWYCRSRHSTKKDSQSTAETDILRISRLIGNWSSVPILMWLLIPIPNRFFHVIRFFSNRSSPLMLHDHILYYFKLVISGASGSALMGWALLAGFSLGVITVLRKTNIYSNSTIFIAMSGLSIVIITCHSYKLARLFIPVIPMLTLGSLSEWFRFGRERKFVRWLGIGILFWMLFSHTYTIVSSKTPNQCLQYYSPKEVADILEYLDTTIPADQNTLIIGTLNELSPGLIISYLLEQKGSIPTVQFELPLLRDLNRSDVGSEGSMERYAKQLNHSLKTSSFDLILVIVMRPDSPLRTMDWVYWNAWKENYIALIQSHRKCIRISTAIFDTIGVSIEGYLYQSQ